MFFRSFILFLFVSTAAGAAIPNRMQNGLEKYASHNRKDKIAADHYTRLIKTLKRDRTKIKDLNKYISSFNRSSLFKELVPDLKKIKSIIVNHNNVKLIGLCYDEGEKSADPLIRRVEKYIHRLCIKKMIQQASTSDKLLKINKFKKYLQREIIKFLNADQKQLSHILSKLQYGSAFHEAISTEIVEQSAKVKNRHISEEIIKNLFLDQKITQKLQEKKIVEASGRRLFRTEFKSLLRKIYDNIENESPFLQRSITQLLSFHDRNKTYLDDKVTWKQILNAGKRLNYVENRGMAKQALTYSKIIAPSGETEESIFQILWLDIQRGEYRKARETIYNYKIRTTEISSPRLKYWVARVFEKTGNVDGARQIYQQLASDRHLNFYAILSAKVLAKNKLNTKFSFINQISENVRLPASQIKYTELSQKLFKRIGIWVELGYHVYSKHDLYYLVNQPVNKIVVGEVSGEKEVLNKLHFDISRYLKDKGNHLLNFQILAPIIRRKEISMNKPMLQNLFPMDFISIIEKHADFVDPLVILSLIRQESAFNPTARSHVGARGLMQLMPATARQMDRKVTRKKLKRPEVNLKLGIRYLKKLLNQYDGNLIYSLAAYNAGPNRVKRWSKEIFKSKDPLKIIESIPFKETRDYVKLIYRNLFYYELLNNKLDLKKPIDKSFFIETT